MKERPILFSAPMVQALLAGRKTQTRRVIKPRNFPGIVELMRQGVNIWVAIKSQFGMPDYQQYVNCPYGQPGDRLWLRETWGMDKDGWDEYRQSKIEPWHGVPNACAPYYLASEADPSIFPRGYWHPSIHMPRWASRITLEVTEVRVQKMQEISVEDAVKEGISRKLDGGLFEIYGRPGFSTGDPIESFRSLWDSINAARGYGWEANPWVWVVSFKLLPRGAC